MIRLATVFSGIGAIEHALDRMGLEHEIVFACDNGDEIAEEIENLKEIINSVEKEKDFSNQLKQCENRFKKAVKK